MTATFLLCMSASVLMLYAPGYLISRSLGLDPITAFAFAPVPCIAFYAGIPIIYGFLNISCTWASVTIPTFIICAACWAGKKLHARSNGNLRAQEHTAKKDWVILILYPVIGVMLCGFVFITSLNGLDSFDAKHDNMTHYNYIRSFVDSGIWSSLTTSSYHGTGLDAAAAQNTFFYPSAWHSLASILVSLLGCDVAIAVNALNAMIMGVIFPLSMYAFLRKLFPCKPLNWIIGAFVSLAFVAFPWALLIKGPLYSNILAFAILPGVFSVFIELLSPDVEPKAAKALRCSTIGILSLIALGLSQPNSVFVFLLFAIFYAAPVLKERFQHYSSAGHSFNPALFYGAYALCASLAWTGLTNLPLPLFDEVVHFENPGDINLTPAESIFNTLSFSFILSPPQWVLVIMAFIGGLYLVVCNRGRLTLLALYMLFAYCISRFMTGFPKFLITGFWYNDSWRLGACAALFLIPLVVSGLALTINTLASFLEKTCAQPSRANPHSEEKWTNKKAVLLCATAVIATFSIINFFPNYAVIGYSNTSHLTPFGYVKQRIAKQYGKTVEQVYSQEEREFVQKALEIVPEGAVIINQPNDGSVFAYGLDGLNTYYRSIYLNELNDDATKIRTDLNQLDNNEDMKSIIDSMGKTYVLLLDHDKTAEDGGYLNEYTAGKAKNWDGINNIDDDTPSFETILAEGDMRLYKVS